MRSETIWITWESQRRNRELAKALEIHLYEWADIDAIESRLLKYGVGVSRTLRLLAHERPRLVVCQNPSIVLASLLLVTRGVSGTAVVVDAHNAGLLPGEGRSETLKRIARWIQRRADLTLVSNDGMKSVVDGNGGRALVVPDRIPDLPAGSTRSLGGRLNVLFVCSFAEDEPYQDVFEAARRLDPDVVVHVTGNYRKKGIQPEGLPPNLELTGYLSEDRYWEMMRSVDVVMDLTNRDHCLVCGAYEAMAAGKPMVLSDKEANRRYFNLGAVYAGEGAESIAGAVREALRKKEELAGEIVLLRETRTREWQGLRDRLRERIDALLGVGRPT